MDAQEQSERVTQTVEFVATFFYRSMESQVAGIPMEKIRVFSDMEEMILTFRKEKNRRARKDRATDGQYYLRLTEHGKQICAKYPNRAKSHYEAIDKTHTI